MQHGQLAAINLQHVLSDALDRSGHLIVVLESRNLGEPTAVAVNDAFCRMTGQARPQILGRTLGQLVPSEGNKDALSDVAAALQARKALAFELLCRDSKGKLIWLSMHLMPVADRERACSVLMGRDVSEAVHAREQQDATQGLLAKVFLFVQAAVVIVDERGIILMANPATHRLLGYAANTLAGRSALDLVPPGAQARVAAARAGQLVDGKDYTIEASLLRAEGSELPVRISAAMVQREDLKRFRILTIEPLSRDAAMRIRVAGRIALVGIEEVREALGAKWPAVAARAMATAEHVLRQRCGPADTFTRTEDGAFVVCFAETTEEDAAFRAAMLAREIRTRLIGDGQSSEAAEVTAVTAAVAEADTPGETEAGLTARLNRRLKERIAAIEAQAREDLVKIVGSAECELEEIRGSNLRSVVARFARMPWKLERRIQAALAALPSQETAAFDFDRMLLHLAGEQAAQGLAAGRPEPILLGIEFEMFLDRRRTERFVAASHELDERLRQRLVPVLARIPPGTPQSRALECALRLRSMYRALALTAVDLTLPQLDWAVLRNAILVVENDDIVANHSNHLAALRKLVAAVHAHGGMMLVRNLRSSDAARAAASCGVDMLSLADAAHAGEPMVARPG
ncbi:MAG: PAS domain S-box protein [Acetobacteraceae bacterium]|nr:PAS domain S-box protein [Acetobacteraceae bacterium]